MAVALGQLSQLAGQGALGIGRELSGVMRSGLRTREAQLVLAFGGLAALHHLWLKYRGSPVDTARWSVDALVALLLLAVMVDLGRLGVPLLAQVAGGLALLGMLYLAFRADWVGQPSPRR